MMPIGGMRLARTEKSGWPGTKLKPAGWTSVMRMRFLVVGICLSKTTGKRQRGADLYRCGTGFAAGSTRRNRPWKAAAGDSGALDQGADAFGGEDFEQQRVFDAAVDDVRGLHAAVDRIDRVADLGDHAAGDCAVGDQLVY